MTLTVSDSVSLVPVSHVLLMSSEIQVFGVDTVPDVALVTDASSVESFALRDRPDV